MLPYNASIWAASLITMTGGLFAMLKHETFVYPRHFGLLMLFPAGLVLGGFLTGIERPAEWLIRLGVILGGMLFWFSLFQYRLTRRQVDTAIYLVLASIMIQGLIGLSQILPNNPFKGLMPWVSGKVPAGIYQQANLHASMMATGIALALYQATTPAFLRMRWPFKALVLMTLLLASANIVTIGSRVGYLGLVIALTLLILSRGRLLFRRKLTTALLVAAIAGGAAIGLNASDTGTIKTLAKIERLTANEGVSGDARPHIYRLAWHTFLQSPLIGHGIGSFQHVFQENRPAYYQQVPNYKLDDKRFSHPHNELLFWMIEGGILALLSIAAAAVAVVWQLIQMGWQRGAAMAALLAPIALHTQVELPFYISSIHWIILLILLFLCFQSGKQVRRIQLSRPAQNGVRVTALFATPLLIIFLAHALLATSGLVQYMRSKGTQPKHLAPAMNDFYFREMGEYFWMRALLYREMHQKVTDHTQEFIDWAHHYTQQTPDKLVYTDIARAYLHLGEQQQAIETLAHVRAIYPDDKQLEKFEDAVVSGRFTADTSDEATPSPLPASQAQ
ncbi:PglL family O-oligosaccharyltransferase [Marinobacterium zhoushanense]|nr:O-antigen ligase family protein [Marinobacterium zhoushanense]